MSDEIGPGTQVRHRKTGAIRVIKERKYDGTGWWNTDGSGFCDAALASDDWEIQPMGAPVAQSRQPVSGGTT